MIYYPIKKILSFSLIIGFIITWIFWKVYKITYLNQKLKETIPIYYLLSPFKLKTNDEKKFSNLEMNGIIWIANTIYINNNPKNKKLMAIMKSIYASIENYNKIKLMSIVINSEKIEQNLSLKKFAKKNRSGEKRWIFLKGDQKSINNLIFNGFRLMINNSKKKEHVNLITSINLFHSEKIILIDDKQQVRGYYNSFNMKELNRLLKDANILVK